MVCQCTIAEDISYLDVKYNDNETKDKLEWYANYMNKI